MKKILFFLFFCGGLFFYVAPVRATVGQTCLGYGDCTEEEYCDLNSANLSTTFKTCQIKKDSGDLCAFAYNCKSNICDTNKKCVKCTLNSQCPTSPAGMMCINGECKIQVVGNNCVSDTDCGGNYYCDSTQNCQLKKPNGVVCSSNNNCQSNYCDTNRKCGACMSDSVCPDSPNKMFCTDGKCRVVNPADFKGCECSFSVEGEKCQTDGERIIVLPYTSQTYKEILEKIDKSQCRMITTLLSKNAWNGTEAQGWFNTWSETFVSILPDKCEKLSSSGRQILKYVDGAYNTQETDVRYSITCKNTSKSLSDRDNQTQGQLPSEPGSSANVALPIAEITLDDPLGNRNLFQIFGGVIKAAMGIIGSLALMVFVYGGVLWLTSAGNEERIKKGTNSMLWATIGIFVIFASYAILDVILKGLMGI